MLSNINGVFICFRNVYISREPLSSLLINQDSKTPLYFYLPVDALSGFRW